MNIKFALERNLEKITPKLEKNPVPAITRFRR